ncbi:MAG: cobalamin B12-binding domain-containing protein [Candidatus Ozemobacteraceae bacterium]
MSRRILITTLAGDPHTQGLFKFTRLAREAGFEILALPPGSTHDDILAGIRGFDPDLVGFSYRLSPDIGLNQMSAIIHQMSDSGLLKTVSGKNRTIGFAGLPDTVSRVVGSLSGYGIVGLKQSVSAEETIGSVMDFLSVTGHQREKIMKGALERLHPRNIPLLDQLAREVAADEKVEEPLPVPSPEARGSYVERIMKSWPERPILRTHYGEPGDSIAPTVAGIRTIAEARVIDELSLGSSDLSQRYYNDPKEWIGRKNDGGVPYKNFQDLCLLRDAAQYGNFPAVKPYCHVVHCEEFVDECLRAGMLKGAHQAVPLFWFDVLDGRGPTKVRDAIAEHIRTVKKLSDNGIPVEMNDPNHWCSRWASDAVVATSYALLTSVMRSCGVKDMVLQMQFNKPKEMSDFGDLAKFMAGLELARTDIIADSANVFIETRTGIEWLEPDLEVARCQLARSTLLQMFMNPHAIHLVSYCEALYAAKPEDIIRASMVIRKAVKMFKKHRQDLEKLLSAPELLERKEYLLREARYLIREIAKLNPAYREESGRPVVPIHTLLADPDALHSALEQGYMAAPGIFTEPYRKVAALTFTDVMDGGMINPIDPKTLAPISEEARISLLKQAYSRE